MGRRRLDNWIESYLEYTKNLEAPEYCHRWMAIGAIAGALRRKVYFRMGYFDWSPNFYIIFVAPSGIVGKSTTMRTAIKFLREIPDIRIGPDTLTSQSFIDELKEAHIERFLPNGETVGESCLTFGASELGVLLNPKDQDMLSALTHLWDGDDEPFKKRTRMYSLEEAPAPWLNIIACTVPSWFAKNFDQELIEGGFVSRCIFLYADEKRHLVAYPAKMMDAEKKMGRLKEDLQHDLGRIATLAGEYRLTEGAEKFGEEWYEGVYNEAKKKLTGDDVTELDGYVARKQGHAHKIAMVLAAAEGDELVITEKILRAAVQHLKERELDAARVLKGVGAGVYTRYIEEMERMLEMARGGRFDYIQMYRHFFRRYGMLKDDFNKFIDSAVGAGIVKRSLEGERTFLEKRDDHP